MKPGCGDPIPWILPSESIEIIRNPPVQVRGRMVRIDTGAFADVDVSAAVSAVKICGAQGYRHGRRGAKHLSRTRQFLAPALWGGFDSLLDRLGPRIPANG